LNINTEGGGSRAERSGRRILRGLLLLCCAMCIGCAAVRHGHVVGEAWVPNHDRDFDFKAPPCPPAPRPPVGGDDLLLRYLGVGGLYLEWRGASILTAPFFSNYGELRAGFRDVGWDEEAIRQGLADLPLADTGAVLVGHSHYDHLGDLPPILLDYAPRARVYVNRSGVNMLAAFEALETRLEVLEELLAPAALDEQEKQKRHWIRLRDAHGVELPFRIRPLVSEHAPHYHGYHYGDGEVTERWTSWEGKSLKAMKEGRTYAFLIDLLAQDSETIAFRIFYQDAVSPPPMGFPPAEEVRRREVDLAILCAPPYWEVEAHPEAILERTRPRHVLVTHYEDFLHPRDEPLRFVATLTNERADEFLSVVADGVSHAPHEPRGPEPCCCGPCGPAWSMPLPGEWLRFRTR
jgi:hypothetical protein